MEGNLKFIDGIIIGTVDEAVFVNGTNKTIAENNPLFECERINLYDKNNPDSHIKVKPNTTYYFTGGEMCQPSSDGFSYATWRSNWRNLFAGERCQYSSRQSTKSVSSLT